MKRLGYALLFTLFASQAHSQSCCSGGSGSPIAGGTSQGVLYKGQAEAGMNFQYIYTDVFLTGCKRADDLLDNYKSQYLYSRLAYGVSDKLTLSLESGYYINRQQVSLNQADTVHGSGFGDVIVFPRYSIYSKNTEKTRDEITLGLGWKIPVGKYLDSSVAFRNPATGFTLYTPKPPAVMPTTGSNDFIFYGFAYRGYPEIKCRLFTTFLYVKKGWNPLGQKFGDYASLSVFGGKTLRKGIGLLLEVKGEHIGKMDYVKDIDMLAKYNLDVNSTGSRKLLLTPQISYTRKDFSTFVSTEIPLYQYVNGTAIASKYLATAGVSYRFYPVKKGKL
jgi:hypothetical protein